MTYGWAILIMLIVIAVLFYLGILNPRGVAPNSLAFSPGFTAYDYQLDSNGDLYLDLGQATGDDITIISIYCATDEGGESPAGSSPSTSQIKNGEHAIVANGNIHCIGAGDSGSFYKGKITIYYTKSISPFTHKAVGDLAHRLDGGTGGGSVTPGEPTSTPEPACTVTGDPPCNCDGYCAFNEDHDGCPWDCLEGASCNNNGICEEAEGETSANCPHDCHLLVMEGLQPNVGRWPTDTSYVYPVSESNGAIYKISFATTTSCTVGVDCEVLNDAIPTSNWGITTVDNEHSTTFDKIFFLDWDNDAIYYVSTGDGSLHSVIQSPGLGGDIGVDSQYVYAVDENTEQLVRAGISAGVPEAIADLSGITDNEIEGRIRTDSSHLYFFMCAHGAYTPCTLYRTTTKEPGATLDVLSSTFASPSATGGVYLNLYNGYLYWAQADGVYRTPTSASGPGDVEQLYSDTIVDKNAVVDGFDEQIFWANSELKMMKGPLDGSTEPVIAFDLTQHTYTAGGISAEYGYYADPALSNNVYRVPRP